MRRNAGVLRRDTSISGDNWAGINEMCSFPPRLRLNPARGNKCLCLIIYATLQIVRKKRQSNKENLCHGGCLCSISDLLNMASVCSYLLIDLPPPSSLPASPAPAFTSQTAGRGRVRRPRVREGELRPWCEARGRTDCIATCSRDFILCRVSKCF